MEGELPPALSGACGSYHNGTLYVFGGCDPNGHTNQVGELFTEKVRLHAVEKQRRIPGKDTHIRVTVEIRLIYFGGYGCKTIREVNNSRNFTVDESSWATIGTAFFRFWGWNSEVNVFDTHTATWKEPETHGQTPAPRASHTGATLGDKGYICGGLEDTALDIHCLDLDTWIWTRIDLPSSLVPVGRSMHTLTPVSDHTLFLFGGLSITGDGWEFDTQTKTWREMDHLHHDKPRLCEDCIGRNADVLQEQLSWLPPKLQETVDKRVSFFRIGPNQENKKQLDLVLD
ncbi:unnamed protein product [Coregonus sp. 'balchen']|nr:unnamed protein product [Coregonus sp. 'balchen']